MTVYRISAEFVKKSTGTAECYLFEFSDSESMIKALVELYRHKKKADTRLYTINGRYRLAVSADSFTKEAYHMCEYCSSYSLRSSAVSYTEEHGRLISRDAVNEIGSAFFKGF